MGAGASAQKAGRAGSNKGSSGGVTHVVSNSSERAAPIPANLTLIDTKRVNSLSTAMASKPLFEGSKTRVICTLGPASRSVSMIKKLLFAGMRIARFNFSHGTHEYHFETLSNLRAACKEIGQRCGVLLDTKGPEIRTGFLKGHEAVMLEQGQTLTLTTDYSFEGDSTKIACSYPHLCRDVKIGTQILCADGSITLEVKDVLQDEVVTEVLNSSKLGERKNMNLPGVQIDLPVITDKDKIDLVDFGLKHEVDFVAASFVQSAADVELIRDTLGGAACTIKIISKIENQSGLNNFTEILEASDGIMIARGDLGMEVPMQKVFVAQKLMTQQCNLKGKPVITATQMLESMVVNPRPTRAEATDVANAVLDGTDCVMLSGETANGAHPEAAVKAMVDICAEAESCLNHYTVFKSIYESAEDVSIHESMASSAVRTAAKIGASAIVVLAASGGTSQLIAKYRPEAAIIVGVVPVQKREALEFQGMGDSSRLVRQSFASRGLYPMVCEDADSTDDLIVQSMAWGRDNGLCKPGDKVVAVHRAQQTQVLVMKILCCP
ncbi:pyruvate kinase [Chloropicon primus]|uniref:Pyruvate kinase n=1 Tax=Chloropicon primus TaxID=1764295 RepID=A0A5B8MUZ3_9CHLO|nr:pyruvate kinase [Chloropicon primus]|eukprot:QDZ23455.1 pyruvate kinase [Chloropicon primus]